MIEELNSEYKEGSYVASDEEKYISAANGGTGTPEDLNIKQEEYDSGESVEDELVPQNVSSIWRAKDETEWGSNPLPSTQTRSCNILC